MTAPSSQSLWANAAVAANGLSASASVNGLADRTISVTSSAPTTITLQASRDNVNFTTVGGSGGTSLVLSGAGSGTVSVPHELDAWQTVTGDLWVRLQSSAAATITAVLNGNPF